MNARKKSDATPTRRIRPVHARVKGRVRFQMRGGTRIVEQGDTLHFKGDIPHRWENAGPGTAQVLMVCAFGYER